MLRFITTVSIRFAVMGAGVRRKGELGNGQTTRRLSRGGIGLRDGNADLGQLTTTALTAVNVV